MNCQESERCNVRACIRPVRLRAVRLLDLQLWCWGQDIHEDGNLLRAYGFVKRRPPDPAAGGCEYVWQHTNGLRITLWGYGLHIMREDEAGLFLKRYAFAPRWTPPGKVPTDYWHVQSWKRARSPRTSDEDFAVRTRLSELCAWIAEYESWIAGHTGIPYRARCLQRWHKEAVVPAEAVAPSWAELANHFQTNQGIES